MDDKQRGIITNRFRGTQCHDFSGLRFGNITATNIDGLYVIEYHNIAYIFFELKYKNASMPNGQRLALERLCDDLSKPTLLIVASHEDEGDIDVANSTVCEFRYKHRWRVRNGTTAQLVESFLNYLREFEAG